MSASVTYWQSVWNNSDAVTVFPFAEHAPGNQDGRVLMVYAGESATEIYCNASPSAEECRTRFLRLCDYYGSEYR